MVSITSAESSALGEVAAATSEMTSKVYREVSSGGHLLTGRDTLDTATASKTANSRLGDTLDIVAKDLAVALGAALSKAFASFAT